MKKLLFILLLISSCVFAQTDTGDEQVFDYGIKNNAAQTVTSAAYITTTSATGTQGKILPANLPVSTATQTAIDAKVGDFINDNATTIAPSMNAVYDALQEIDLQSSYDKGNTITTTALGAVTVQEGTGNDANNVLVGKNNAGTTTFSVSGAGVINASNKQNSLAVDGTGVKFPTVDAVNTKVSNIDNTSDANKPVSTATQTALNLKENVANKNVANGYAGLGSDGKLISSQLPSITITDTFVVGSQAAMLALTAQTGDVAVRTDLNKSYILKETDPTLLASWQELLTPTSAVTTVFGRNGAVTAQTGDYTTAQVTETTNNKYQSDNQDLYNDATSSIQTQFNNTVHLTGTETITGVKTFTQAVKAASIQLTGGTGNSLYYGHTNKLVLANYEVGGGIDFETNGGTVNMNLGADANLSVVGTVSASNGTLIGTTDIGTYAIKNQNSSAQSANMWISGTGKFGGNLVIGNDQSLRGINSFGTEVPLVQLQGTLDNTIIYPAASGRFIAFSNYAQNQNNLLIADSGAATFNSSVTANGNSVINGGAGADVLYLQKSTGASLGLSGATGTTNSVVLTATNSTNPGLDIYVGGAIRQSISPSGNVLIGTTTDNGVNKLQVNGSGKFTGTDIIMNSIESSNTTGSFFRFRKTSGTTRDWDLGATGTASGEGDNKFGLYDNTAGAYRFSINSSGVFKINNLAGTGTRTVVADASGNLSTDSTVYAPLASPALTGTPTAPTATVGTNTTQIATTAFVQAIRPYKVYTALLTQSGTGAPTATVLENTLGGTVTWGYVATGQYSATLTSAFTVNKTVTFVNQGATYPMAEATFNRQDANSCTLRTFSANTLTETNGVMVNDVTMVEIRVYN